MTDSLIHSLDWMVGPWAGSLGTDKVEECWSKPVNGCMDTCIRLSGPDAVRMLELIVIEEITADDGNPDLILHLRQFGPTLDLRTDQDLNLETLSAGKVRFVDPSGSSISGLAYELLDSGQMEVSVTVPTGDVLKASLARPVKA